MKLKNLIELKPLDLKGKSLWTALAFAFPILCLIMATGLNEWHLRTGQTVTFPVEGYDPRDLLSGRYLRYKILYNATCPADEEQTSSDKKTKIIQGFDFFGNNRKAYLCLQGKKKITVSRSAPKNCPLFIKGHCLNKGEFYARGNRLYLPDTKTTDLEKLFHKAEKKEVLLSVTKGGRILAKDILIDGQSLKEISRHFQP